MHSIAPRAAGGGSGGVAYTNTALRNVSEEAATLQDGLNSGNHLPTVPEWSAKAAIGYQVAGQDLGLGGVLADGTVNARLAYNYMGSRYTDASNFGKLPPVHLVSARLGVAISVIAEVYFFGDNLLDEEYMKIKHRFGTDADGNPVFGVSDARGATVDVPPSTSDARFRAPTVLWKALA